MVPNTAIPFRGAAHSELALPSTYMTSSLFTYLESGNIPVLSGNLSLRGGG